MADKENFSIGIFFYLSPLLEDLRNLVHRSINIYVAKNSGYKHMTSRVDLYSGLGLGLTFSSSGHY